MREISFCACFVLAFSTAAVANYTFDPFSLTVGDVATSFSLPVASVPVGNYSGYKVTVDWSSLGGDAWSSDALWHLDTPSGPVPLANPGVSADGQPNTDSRTLSWSGSFAYTYQGGDLLDFLAVQDFQGSTAAWSNISLELTSGLVPPPTPPVATDLGAITAGTTTHSDALTAGEVIWYKFSIATVKEANGDYLTIDTLASTLTGGTFGDGNDSEIALYSAAGLRLATNDDVDRDAGDLLSALNFGLDLGLGADVVPAGDLLSGEYYLAVAGFDSDFGASGFEVTSDSAVHGAVQIALNTSVPEPAMLPALVLAGAVLFRRGSRANRPR